MAKKHILIICGEASGDLNAANLAKKIFQIDPDIKISGVGGPHLRNTGADILYDSEGLAVIGFFDVIKKLPKFFRLQKLILRKIKEEKPNVVILVDFGGFNLRLAKKINNKAIKTIYYISPQVWASRPGRIKTIKNYINKMVVIFKFEEEFYKKHGIDVEFVGHPLLDIAKPTMENNVFLRKFNLSADKTIFALLPGSRRSEIKYILPVMLEACSQISKEIKALQFVIAKSPNVEWNVYSGIIKRHEDIEIEIIEGQTYDCLNIAKFCLVASGMATLETAIMEKPFAIIYKIGLLNYLLYRPQVKIPYIGMVNIVAGKKIIPEFIQFRATPEKISQEIIRIFNSPQELETMKNELTKVKTLLGEKGATERAAKVILNCSNS